MLPNCKIANSSIDCKECNEEFYLDTNTSNCNFGFIWGCAIYTNLNTCNQCK